MKFRLCAATLAAAALAQGAARAAPPCQIAKLAELPLTMIGSRAIVEAKINGRSASFVADSGAFFSMVTAPNAAKFGLILKPMPWNFRLEGVTGEAASQIGTARDFGLARFTLHNVEFIVAGGEVGAGSAGLLGQNFFRIGDVEYDLAGGAIRMFRLQGCARTNLAYWAKPDQPFTVIPILSTTPQEPHTRGDVYLNGVRLRATFDTGAESSILTLAAAARAGIKPGGPGVVAAGLSGGIGPRLVQSWIAPAQSFKIGDEEVRNTRLRIGAIDLIDSDILLGADFFLSHHIFVVTSQHKLYLTYNRGPVFNLDARSTQTPAAPTVASSTPASGPDEPTDAVDYGRRGAALLARNQSDKAISELSHAIELDPSNAQYLHERALARLANNQPLLARADLDAALRLSPSDVEAHVLRARFEARDKDKAKVIADLDAASTLAAKQDDVRLQIAEIDVEADQLPAAIGQYDLWIAVHGEDARKPQALNGRCWARALLGTELPKALKDCSEAIRARITGAAAYDSRGLVYLRMGEDAKAIVDYDAALQLDPKIGWSLYGRGLAKLHEGHTAEAAADLAAAATVAPKLADVAKAHGIEPR